jgi:outer membrane protein OmpA-like peptidoglycan-associated protein
MKRSIIAFIVIVGTAVLILAGAALTRYGSPDIASVNTPEKQFATSETKPLAASNTSPVTVIPKPTIAQPTVPAKPVDQAAATVAALIQPQPLPGDLSRLKPIWGPNYREGDGLGSLICGAYAFSADYVLQQIQMQGLDVKRGFHLGIVPFYLNEKYVVTAKDRADALEQGVLDCLLTTFDLMALEDPGILTAFINESAGADQIWARNIKSLNELKGKRIAFEANGPSAFQVYDLLNTVGLTSKDVQLLPQSDQNTSIAVFNKGEADVVAGWTPVIFAAKEGNGQVLATTKDFRSILGGIVMSKQAMQSKRAAIQLFHDAWFEALSLQETNFDDAANKIAQWGKNDYLGVSVENAPGDLRNLLDGVAQANLADNVRAFSNVGAVVNRLLQTRKLWSEAGHQVPQSDVTSIVNPEFVLTSARGFQIDTEAPNKFVNNTFSLGRTRAVAKAPEPKTENAVANATPVPPSENLANAKVVATLPCSRFEFVPNTAQLQVPSQQELRDCALRVLQQNLNLYVRVKGSSAWPGPKGAVKRELVEQTAQERAQAVVDFFVGQGINKDRFVVEWTMPPQDHWETTDLAKQSQDRYVELTLLVSGL